MKQKVHQYAKQIKLIHSTSQEETENTDTEYATQRLSKVQITFSSFAK